MTHRIILALIASLALSVSHARQSSGVQGTVSNEAGESLPFATVYIRNLNTGTATNAEGRFEVRLAPGKYDLVFKYIGYEAQVIFVEVGQGFETLDVRLKTQTIMLRNVEVRAGREDPAYTIMRKAIAKSKFHTQQLDSYEAKLYMKGSGRVIDVPFFLRKAMEKEGVDSTMAFVSESVSVLNYERPNKITQQIIAVHSQGEDNDTGPEEFITASFYEPEVNGSISPLSPKAFSYYRFTYEGSFQERGYEINKIQVTPRSPGDNVFEGTLYIVEQLWSIHSLDLKTSEFGLDFTVKEVFAPVEDKAWLPISHKIDVEGTFFGIEFEYDYLATLSDYKIELNPDLIVEFEVLDEKIFKEEAKQAEIKNLTDNNVINELSTKKELTRKDLRKLMKEYEKQEAEEMEFPDVISNVTMKTDSSTMYNDDSLYWTNIRPVPLNSYETRGYEKMEEFAQEEEEESKKDSVKQKTFHLYDLVVGNRYKLGKDTRLILRSPLASFSFNAVEGYHFNYQISLRKKLGSNNRIEFGPNVRYSFAREKLIGKFFGQYDFGKGLRKGTIRIASGRDVSQFNTAEPIHPYINTFTTLILEENYLKLYQKDFGLISFQKGLDENISLSASLEFQDRQQLFNNTTHTWFNRKNKTYEPNAPVNAELAATDFSNHRALIGSFEITYQPWQKYKIVNGRKRAVEESSPAFILRYKKGFEGAFSSDVDYDLIAVGMDHKFDLGVRNKIDVKVEAGTFLNDNKMSFVDFQHFMGNQTPFATTDPSKSFRLLNYYLYSTNDKYVVIHLHDQFRKLLITRLPLVRAFGLKENLFVNYLRTDASRNFVEVGYGLDNLFRVFRLEAITAWQDGSFEDLGFRIGIATNLDDLFE